MKKFKMYQYMTLYMQLMSVCAVSICP